MARCSIEQELLPIEVIGIFDHFCSCNIALDPVAFMYTNFTRIHGGLAGGQKRRPRSVKC